MSNNGLPVTDVVGVSVTMGQRRTQGASSGTDAALAAQAAAANAAGSANRAEQSKNEADTKAQDAIDELNKSLEEMQEAIRNSGYTPVDSFEDGFTLTNISQALRLKATNVFYSWRGEYPKTVPAGSTPETTGGFGKGAWVDVNDLTLRSELKGARGFGLVGGFFNAEGSADAGISESINQRSGSRGHFAVFANNDIDETGAAMAFGGDDYTANVIVNWDGHMKTQHVYRGMPTSNFIHYPHIQNTGYLSESGYAERRMLLPSDGYSSDPNSPDIVFYEDSRKLLRMKLRMPGKFANLASDERRTSFIPTTRDIAGFRSLNLFNIPIETDAGTNIPGQDYRLRFDAVALGSSNYNISMKTWAYREILSLWKTNLNKYLIFRIRDSSGGDTTKWGIYKIDYMYKQELPAENSFMMIQFRYDAEPDGTVITKHPSKNAPPIAPGSNRSYVNYTDMKLVFTDIEIPVGTGFNDPFAGVKIDSYGAALAFGLRDPFRPESYVSETKTFVASVNFDEKTTTTGTAQVITDNRFMSVITHYSDYTSSGDFNKNLTLTKYLGDMAKYGAVMTSLLPSPGNISNEK